MQNDRNISSSDSGSSENSCEEFSPIGDSFEEMTVGSEFWV